MRIFACPADPPTGTGWGSRSVRSTIVLDALVRLCPPPAEPPPAVDRAQAERTLGAALPADYEQLE
ncbi:hypothetical protein ACFCZ1_03795 [Streptomyces sp. NPDC056224]|uniref:hypothetical protein n=1 Tax=Streptomyces sp. NPDC056224 TaxID=3345750 RepID=UPI0035E2048F